LKIIAIQREPGVKRWTLGNLQIVFSNRFAQCKAQKEQIFKLWNEIRTASIRPELNDSFSVDSGSQKGD
jgi:hypothetical protein